MDRETFNFDQARKLLLAEPNIVAKVFVMNAKTRALFKLSDDSHLIHKGNGLKDDLLQLYGKDVKVFSEMPDNIVGMFLTKDHLYMIQHQSNWSADEIRNWISGPRYIKNAPFRILNIGYIEVGESAFENMVSDPKALASHQFIEKEIY